MTAILKVILLLSILYVAFVFSSDQVLVIIYETIFVFIESFSLL